MKVSIVIATYNGEEYIYNQLESIRKQKRLADEIVISDDNSTDNTLKICLDYVEKFKLDNWKIVKTESNLGYYGNFMNAIEESSGDIIFLADQDDEWLDNKIDEMAGIMERNDSILSLASTFSYIDGTGKIIKDFEKHPYGRKDGIINIDLYKFYRHPYYLGMSMAIRRSLYDRIKDVDSFNLTHDLMFNLYASQKEGFFFYNKVLTKRRIHGHNTSGLTSKRDKAKEFSGSKDTSYQIWRKVKHYTMMLNILKYDGNINEKNILVLEKFIRSQENRYQYVDKRRILGWMKNIKNIKFYETKLHFINDLLLLLKRD